MHVVIACHREICANNQSCQLNENERRTGDRRKSEPAIPFMLTFKIHFIVNLRKPSNIIIFLFQENVSHPEGILHGNQNGPALRSVIRRGSSGQQTLPIRVPSIVVAGGGQSGSPRSEQVVRSPGLPLLRGTAEETGRVFREGQAHQ